jgi:hypothetical protein
MNKWPEEPSANEPQGGAHAARPVTAPTRELPPARPDTAGVDLLLGQYVGHFRLTRVLGTGGMGTVYLGENERIGSQVAVKVLNLRLAADTDCVSRFFAEARAANMVRHPHVVPVLDQGELPDGRPYLMMEYLTGCTLERWVTERHSCAQIVEVLAQVADGLAAAHQHLIHRDLKPENLFLLDPDADVPFVKIGDFGIARGLARGDLTQVGMLLGTPAYMAPEFFEFSPATVESDLYALGVIGFRLLTGQFPYECGSLGGWFQAHRHSVPPSLHALRSDVPEALEQVLMRALAKSPRDRFSSAQAFAEALRASRCQPIQLRAAAPVTLPPAASAPGWVAEALLHNWERRDASAPYALLKLTDDAPCAEVELRLQQRRDELAEVGRHALHPGQQVRLERARAMLEAVERALGTPLRRAAFDAHSGNAAGVKRCLEAGLSHDELERLEQAFEQRHPGTRARAEAQLRAAQLLSRSGQTQQIVELLRRALTSAPLCLGLHQRYWPLRAQDATPPTVQRPSGS